MALYRPQPRDIPGIVRDMQRFRGDLDALAARVATLESAEDEAGGGGAGGGAGSSDFDLLTDVAPKHYWKASNVLESGGLVDTVTDLGSGGKSFAQTGTPRCPRAQDANGKWYLAPDGANDYYTAGSNADWAFWHNGGPWTLGMVYHRTANPAANEVLLATAGANSANVGVLMRLEFTSASVWGPTTFVFRGSVGTHHVRIDCRRPVTDRVCLVVRFFGDVDSNVSALEHSAQQRMRGALVSSAAVTTAASGANPTGTLTLFSAAVTGGAGTGPTQYTSARLYELWMDDSVVPDYHVRAYEEWAAEEYAL